MVESNTFTRTQEMIMNLGHKFAIGYIAKLNTDNTGCDKIF